MNTDRAAWSGWKSCESDTFTTNFKRKRHKAPGRWVHVNLKKCRHGMRLNKLVWSLDDVIVQICDCSQVQTSSCFCLVGWDLKNSWFRAICSKGGLASVSPIRSKVPDVITFDILVLCSWTYVTVFNSWPYVTAFYNTSTATLYPNGSEPWAGSKGWVEAGKRVVKRSVKVIKFRNQMLCRQKYNCVINVSMVKNLICTRLTKTGRTSLFMH